jgi:hypothetical protein
MKNALTILYLLLAGTVLAQSSDSVSTTGGSMDVFYHLNNGEIKASESANWDMAFNNLSFEASILINEGFGVELYKVSDDVNDWATLDTTGKLTDPIYNSNTSWSGGAFANLGTTHPDYGWGMYNQNNHFLTGSRIFVLKTRNGSYKKVLIEEMSAPGVWTFKLADIDGSNEVTKSYDKKDHETNFYYYNAETDAFVNNEPTDNWHLVFTKYVAEIQQGPTSAFYPVTGVKLNLGLQVAERLAIPQESDDTSNLQWNDNITEIGYDWKSFNRTTFQYDIDDQKTYFVRDENGNTWKIYFTAYQGGQSGTSFFNVKQLDGTADVQRMAIPQFRAYPNPAAEVVFVSGRTNSLRLYSLTGSLVKSATDADQLYVGDLPHGVYTLTWEVRGETQIQKIVIQ